MQPTIGIIGTGKVGSSLAQACRRAGYPVILGSRDPESEHVAGLLRDLGPSVRALRIPEAATEAEVVILAVPWHAVPVSLAALDEGISGKVLIDATNPILWHDHEAHHIAPPSGGELVQELVPAARVVKAFNTLGYEQINDPVFGEHNADLVIAGNDDDGKAVVAGLGTALGFRVLDAGPLASAAIMERLAMLWLALATNGMGRDITFKVLER